MDAAGGSSKLDARVHGRDANTRHKQEQGGLLVENVEQEQEHREVDELPPALHGVGQHDLAAPVALSIQPVLLRLFSGSSRGHGVLTSNAHAKDELSPSIHDHPSLQGRSKLRHQI